MAKLMDLQRGRIDKLEDRIAAVEARPVGSGMDKPVVFHQKPASCVLGEVEHTANSCKDDSDYGENRASNEFEQKVDKFKGDNPHLAAKIDTGAAIEERTRWRGNNGEFCFRWTLTEVPF